MDDQPSATEPAAPAPGAPTLRHPGKADASAPAPPLRLRLGQGGGAVELKGPDVVVGRHSTAGVRLALPDVSRRHCRLVFAENRWQVLDLQSTNGIYVNDRRVASAILAHGDRLRIGSYLFEVDLGAPLAADVSPHRSLERIAAVLAAGEAPPTPHRKAS